MEEGEISSGEEGFSRNLLNGPNLMNSTMSEELRTGDRDGDPLIITPVGGQYTETAQPLQQTEGPRRSKINTRDPEAKTGKI